MCVGEGGGEREREREGEVLNKLKLPLKVMGCFVHFRNKI